MFCPKCGKVQEGEFEYCKVCGSKLKEGPAESGEHPLTQEQPQEPAAQQETQVLNQEPQQVEAPAGQKDNAGTPVDTKKNLLLKILIGVGVGAVVMVIAIVAAILLILGVGSKEKPVLFLKDREIFSTYMSNVDPRQVTQELMDSDEKISNEALAESAYQIGSMVYLADNGKTLFYPDKVDDYVSIYYRNLKRPDQEPTRLAGGVENYAVSENGKRVVYLQIDGSLYRHNLKDREKIATDVEGFVASKDCKQIIFLTEEGDLYEQKLGKGKTKVATEIDDVVYIKEDCTALYYMSEKTLYEAVIGEEKKKLLSEVDDVLTVTEDGKVYYTKAKTEEIPLSEYVTDNLKAADAAMNRPKAPARPTYPSYSDYDTFDEYYDAVDAYNLAMDAYYEALDQYNQQYSKYQEKLDRDALRKELENTKITVHAADVYYFDGKESKIVKENVRCYEYGLYSRKATEADVLIFSGFGNDDTANNKIKFSEITSVSSLEAQIEDAMQKTKATYVAIDGKATQLVSATNTLDAWDFDLSPDGKMIHYLDNVSEEDYHGDLYRITISDGTVNKAELYDSDVYSGAYGADGAYYYFKDVKTLSGDLFVNKVCVDYEVYTGEVYSTEEGVYYYMTDRKDDSGTLKTYNGKKTSKVAEDVYSFTILPDETVLYLRDYSTQRYYGTLFTFNGRKSVKVADDVVAIVHYQ